MIIAATLDAGTRAAWPLVSILPPLGALTTAPSTARAHVNAVLAEWQMGSVSDVAALVASELTTNALRASTTPAGDARYVSGRMALIWMCLMSDRSRLLIEVHDQADGAPVMKDADLTAESGRGLQMVHAMTEGEWGWYPKIGQHGKCVWATLRHPAPRPMTKDRP
jgi:hypothetical protein